MKKAKSKQKKKLVCVGWGIWECVKKELWCTFEGRERWSRRKYAIEYWDNEYGDDSYQWNRQRGLAIAKKLWVEVKDE